jgi:hypothetical protein
MLMAKGENWYAAEFIVTVMFYVGMLGIQYPPVGGCELEYRGIVGCNRNVTVIHKVALRQPISVRE